MNNCEQAFLEYFKTVCPDIDKRHNGILLSDEAILDYWYEAYDDWQAAVRWGQEHPNAKVIKRPRLVNKFSEFAPSSQFANLREWED